MWPAYTLLVVSGLMRYSRSPDDVFAREARRITRSFADQVVQHGPDAGYLEWYDAEKGLSYGRETCNYITMATVLPMARLARLE